jgi:hypothetical protein
MKFKYIITINNYATIIDRVLKIKDNAYKPFVCQRQIRLRRKDKSEIAFFHHQLKKWNIKVSLFFIKY